MLERKQSADAGTSLTYQLPGQEGPFVVPRGFLNNSQGTLRRLSDGGLEASRGRGRSRKLVRRRPGRPVLSQAANFLKKDLLNRIYSECIYKTEQLTELFEATRERCSYMKKQDLEQAFAAVLQALDN